MGFKLPEVESHLSTVLVSEISDLNQILSFKIHQLNLRFKGVHIVAQICHYILINNCVFIFVFLGFFKGELIFLFTPTDTSKCLKTFSIKLKQVHEHSLLWCNNTHPSQFDSIHYLIPFSEYFLRGKYD